ncbi:MAG TPA: hypothetical protein PK509_07365 [Catalimonadaceae bacterium]|nr:hypothetical protein [Catalimonadaceae bacterium]
MVKKVLKSLTSGTEELQRRARPDIGRKGPGSRPPDVKSGQAPKGEFSNDMGGEFIHHLFPSPALSFFGCFCFSGIDFNICVSCRHPPLAS